MKGFSDLFLTYIFISFLATLLVIKIEIPVTSNATEITPAAINETPVNYTVNLSWHITEVWKLLSVAVMMIMVSIRPIDYLANLCNEDEEVKEAKLKMILHVFGKLKKMTKKLRRNQIEAVIKLLRKTQPIFPNN
jgi:hypothetical protein